MHAPHLLGPGVGNHLDAVLFGHTNGMYAVFELDVLMLGVLDGIQFGVGVVGGCGRVLDVAFLFEVFEFVLGEFLVGGFSEDFFEVFALGE